MSIRALSVVLLVLLAACGVPAAPSDDPTSSPADSATGNGGAPATTLSAWHLGDPVDPALPPIIAPYEGRYRVSPDWEVSAINYLYEWSGLDSGVVDVQQITRSGSEYQRDGVALAPQDVERFIQSLDQLYLSQSGASWQSHTDDYPSWNVELQGSDGASMRLSSSSTGNPGAAPWVVRYNGRSYLQYNGAIGAALDALFGTKEATPAASTSFGGSSGDEISFTTFGLSGGPNVQVVGLFPLSADLRFASTVISGSINGPKAIEGMDSANLVQSVARVSLTLPDGSLLDCTLETNTLREEATNFQCPINTLQSGQRFALPIAVEYTDSEGAAQKSSGLVSGIWGVDYDYIAQPLPAELDTALAGNPAIVDLLRDHQLIEAIYSARLKPAQPLGGIRTGSIRLLGQTTIDGASVRYTVNTPFQLKEGVLTAWSLERSDVERMLAAIAGLPVTRRVLQEDPHTIIDLWYAESGGPKEDDLLGGMPMFMFSPQEYALEVKPCGDIPGITLPADSHPLQLFSFNVTKQSEFLFYTQGNQFLLLDDKVVVVEIDMDLIGEPGFGLLPDRSLRSLIPVGLDPSPQRGFSRIWLDTSPYTEDRPVLTIEMPEDATAEERAVYQRQIEALASDAVEDFAGHWTIEGITIVMDSDGRLLPMRCQ